MWMYQVEMTELHVDVACTCTYIVRACTHARTHTHTNLGQHKSAITLSGCSKCSKMSDWQKETQNSDIPQKTWTSQWPIYGRMWGKMNPGLLLPLIRKGPFLRLLMKGKELQLAYNSPFIQSHTAHQRYNILTCNPCWLIYCMNKVHTFPRRLANIQHTHTHIHNQNFPYWQLNHQPRH